MCRGFLFLASFALILSLVGMSPAANITWDGEGANSLWSTGANWSTNTPPTAADDATIDMDPGALIDATVTANALDVIIASVEGATGRLTMTGGTLTVKKTGSGGPGLWIGNRGIGYFDMTGGTITAEHVYLPRNPPGQGYMTMEDGTITTGQSVTLGLHAGEYGEIAMTGGTINVGDMFRCGDAGRGVLRMSGGDVNVQKTFHIGMRKGRGHLQLDGGTLTAAELVMDNQGGSPSVSMDITGGRMIIKGDKTAAINSYITRGWVTAYGGGGEVTVQVVGGDTVVTGLMGKQAWSPVPQNGAADVALDADISWSAGRDAVRHDVYFGTSFADVNGASDPGLPPGRGRQETTTYNPGALSLGQTYYWRVDEVNEAATPAVWRGNVWSFTTPGHRAVDDFDDYNDYAPDRVFDTWADGWEIATNGAQAGYGEPPFTEQITVHSGVQSMPLTYDNTGDARYSEAVRTFEEPQDWTDAGIRAMSLWFYGNYKNQVDRMYVALEDSGGTRKAVYYDTPNALLWHAWQEWNIDLQQFADAGVSLKHIAKLYLGIGDPDQAGPGGKGEVYVDSIRLYPSRCVPEYAPAGDLDGDCDVDYEDLSILAENWLESFVWDVGSGFDGGGCLQLDGAGDRIFVPTAPFPREAFTYALWFNSNTPLGPDSHRADLIYWSAGGPAPGARPALVYNIDGSGRLRASVMLDTMVNDQQGLAFSDSRNFDAQTWHHVAFTFDGTRTCVYVNGKLENTLTFAGVHWQRYTPGLYFGTSSGGGNPFNGRLDDIRIYDYALSADGIADLFNATREPTPGPTAWYKLDGPLSGTVADSSGNGYDGYVQFVQPYTNPFDDNQVGTKDYAVLAESWLEERMWP